MDEVTMLVSCGVMKGDRKIVRVSFQRGSCFAEGLLPDGVIEKAEGFTADEVGKLENYLRVNRKEILEKAKTIDPLRNWMGQGGGS